MSATVTMAQSLNWDGQTGVFVTPLAYTAASPANGIGHPIAAYHFLNAGSVLGNFHQASLTVDALGRTEFGCTRSEHQAGGTAGLSGFWNQGFNIAHGKAAVVKESFFKQNWLPTISAGFVARTQVDHVSGVISKRDNSNYDFYAVATKTVTQAWYSRWSSTSASRPPMPACSAWRATLRPVRGVCSEQPLSFCADRARVSSFRVRNSPSSPGM